MPKVKWCNYFLVSKKIVQNKFLWNVGDENESGVKYMTKLRLVY